MPQDLLIPTFASAPGSAIAESARRIGHYVWVTSRLYEVAGRWAATGDDACDAVGYAALASRFAWQAEQWRRHLPRLREVDPQSLIVPPDASTETSIDRLSASSGDDRASFLGAVIAELGAAYQRHAEAASPLRDGPALRTFARLEPEMSALAAEISDIRHSN